MYLQAMRLIARDGESGSSTQQKSQTEDSQPSGLTPTMTILLIILLVLLVLGIFSVAILLFLRQRRRARKASLLPEYSSEPKRLSDEMSLSSASTSQQHHRRGAARQVVEPVHVYTEKKDLFDHSSSPPDSPLPEIRITFPEEIDEAGKRKSGRVVVVHMGDTNAGNVGLEPVEALPAYQKTDGARFDSIDLERVGGLVEKARNNPAASKEFH